LARAVPEVVVDQAVLPVLALSEDVAGLARLPLLSQLAVLVQLVVLVPLQLEAELVVEVPPLHRLLSAAMAGSSTLAGTPLYSPVPRSGRKAKRRP
jgi:hypothetical protein